MGVTRRTGLGALLGGIFAGPTVAKEAAEQFKTSSIYRYQPAINEESKSWNIGASQSPMPSAEEILMKEQEAVKYTRAKIKYLRQVINGNFKYEPGENEPYHYMSEFHDYDYSLDHVDLYTKSLKSISRSARKHIEHNLRVEQHRKAIQEEAKQQLERLMKEWAKNKLWGKLSDLFE